MNYGPLTLEEAREKVASLRELEEFYREMVLKYGCSDHLRKSIKEVCDEQRGLSNIHTMRPEDFIRFRNGEFGFI